MAEVLRHYGYKTAAFGKWHNTPADQTTAMGPFDRWPTGHGFDYFYGFLAGETSQWEPRLVENTNVVEPPHDEKYHLSEDMARARHRLAAQASRLLARTSRSSCTGRRARRTGRTRSARNGPTSTRASSTTAGMPTASVSSHARSSSAGFRPTRSSRRAPNRWRRGTAFPRPQRPFQRRLMEIYAGFVEHVDVQAGKLIDELERLGVRDNTIVIYIFGDNGASAEGQNGTISELLAQNGIPNTVEQQLAALEKIGGLDALGTPKTDSMYHAGWAWAGNTPFQLHQARRLALRRHAQPDGHLVAEGHQARQHAAVAVPPRQRHRADDLRDRRHQAAEGGRRIQAGPDRRRQPRLHLRRRQGADAQEGAVLRQQRQPRHLPGRLGGGHLRPAGAVAARRAGPGRVGFGQGQVGALRHHQGLLAGRRSRREGAEAPGTAAEDVRRAGQGEQGLSARRRHLAAPAPRGPHQDALHELAVRRHHDAHARVHGARAWAARAAR